jgi:ribosomal protein S18 acetylase RimI-like enzyme
MPPGNRSAAVVVPLSASTIEAAIACAREVWPAAYEPILPAGQVDYMLDDRTDPNVLTEYLTATDRWFDLAVPTPESAPDPVDVLGYTSSRLAEPTRVRLEQLYVVPRSWGTGVADLLFEAVLSHARAVGATLVDLTVNRNNGRALAYYRRIGFEVTGETVADIGGGYVMDDYILSRPVAGGVNR